MLLLTEQTIHIRLQIMNHLSAAFEIDLGQWPEGLLGELSLPTNEDIQLRFLVPIQTDVALFGLKLVLF